MVRILFILFIVIPIIEISVLIQVGSWIGWWPTIAIMFLTAWLGAKQVREQGLATLTSVQTKLAQGQIPSDEIIAGVLLVVAGVLLITPGLLTDLFGLALLFPPLRQQFIRIAKQFVAQRQQTIQVHTHFTNIPPSQAETQHDQQGKTLEGEFERKE